jgi:hypothetical protein
LLLLLVLLVQVFHHQLLVPLLLQLHLLSPIMLLLQHLPLQMQLMQFLLSVCELLQLFLSPLLGAHVPDGFVRLGLPRAFSPE